MQTYIGRDFYLQTFHGSKVDELSFQYLAAEASRKIDELTFGRAEAIITAGTDTDTIEKIKLATCAVADVLKGIEARKDRSAVKQEKVGDISVTYREQSTADDQGDLESAAKTYLWDTELLYRGFADNE